MTNPNDNAFPWDDVGPHPGFTKRELIAAMVLQGFSANPIMDEEGFDGTARAAVKHADALILELNKQEK